MGTCALLRHTGRVDITPETAFAAAQILSVLLVATMFDPWVKGVARDREVSRGWQVGAMISYAAKVLALVVLLFDMQLVLFRNTWSGGMGTALVLGNYFAVVASAMSILLTVLNHMGALAPRTGAASPGTDRDATNVEPAPADLPAGDHPDSDHRSVGAEGRAPTAR